jgi:protein involved in polysaccharide export with SLBB domain
MKLTTTCLVLLLGLAASASAQSPPAAGERTFLADRAELERLLAEHEALAQNASAPAAARQGAEQDAQRIRRRLEEGDFRSGDRVALYVMFEPALSDTFTVSPNRELELPGLAPISMVGVLRTELNDHLTREIGRFVRDPQVRANSLLRVTVIGEIGRPGFFVVASHTVLTELLTLAGGPNRTAALDRIHIERNNERLWDAREIRTALTEGRTLDELNLQNGDRIIVPEIRSRGHTLRWTLATLPPLVWLVVNLRRL